MLKKTVNKNHKTLKAKTHSVRTARLCQSFQLSTAHLKSKQKVALFQVDTQSNAEQKDTRPTVSFVSFFNCILCIKTNECHVT